MGSRYYSCPLQFSEHKEPSAILSGFVEGVIVILAENQEDSARKDALDRASSSFKLMLNIGTKKIETELDPVDYPVIFIDENQENNLEAKNAEEGRTSYLLTENEVSGKQQFFDSLATHPWQRSELASKLHEISETNDEEILGEKNDFDAPEDLGFQRLPSEPSETDEENDNQKTSEEFRDESFGSFESAAEKSTKFDDKGVVVIIGKGAKNLCSFLAGKNNNTENSNFEYFDGKIVTKYYEAPVRFFPLEDETANLDLLSAFNIQAVFLISDFFSGENVAKEEEKEEIWQTMF